MDVTRPLRRLASGLSTVSLTSSSCAPSKCFMQYSNIVGAFFFYYTSMIMITTFSLLYSFQRATTLSHAQSDEVIRHETPPSAWRISHLVFEIAFLLPGGSTEVVTGDRARASAFKNKQTRTFFFRATANKPVQSGQIVQEIIAY